MKNLAKKNVLNVLPKVAKLMGQNSVDSTCHFWVNQPKVPKEMLKK
ncbi:MAG: cyclic lactone autoinducer peptide [Clostridia bacterium]